MMDKCPDVGCLQTFLDGELKSIESGLTARHIADCDLCAVTIADLEQSGAEVFRLIEEDSNVLVPTERLREKVFSSIREFESVKTEGFWSRLSSSFSLFPAYVRPLTALTALLLVCTAAYLGLRSLGLNEPISDVQISSTLAEQPKSEAPTVVVRSAGLETASIPEIVETQDIEPASSGFERTNTVSYESQQATASVAVHRVSRKPVETTVSAIGNAMFVETEEGYLRTISTLNRNVSENKDFVLRPSERVEFERNLAIVNDAIVKMHGEVKSNPGNTAAREVLKSSYRNKIELLNSVADRTGTVASFD